MHSNLFIGIMSGTSLDAVDVALLDFNQRPGKILSTYAHPITDALRNKILQLCNPGDDEINRLGELDAELGDVFAQAVLTLLQKANIDARQVRAIGSHGQTVRHQPKATHPFTLQIGDANRIAVQTGITTIADFRRRDMALGGEGAPLAPAFHCHVLQHLEEPQAMVNIGGIANVTLIDNPQQPQHVVGFDTGPGNMLMDAWAKQHLDHHYDMNGRWAASGNVLPDVLAALLEAPYFKQTGPKSTGRELFNLDWLQPFLHPHDAPEDVQATLAELTAVSIANAIRLEKTEHLWLCGGGAHNTHLVNRLRHLLPNIIINSTSALGIDPDWIEAAAFAWLAKQTLEGKPGNLPSVTGAREATVLGAIFLA